VTTRARRAATAGFLALLAVVSGGLVAPGTAQAMTIRDRQWWLKSLDIARVQKIAKGAGVVVAVIDSGVDPTHADLAGQVLPGAGYGSMAAGTAGHSDPTGHGTSMASVIAGRGGGANHMLGIAPAVKILPLGSNGNEHFSQDDLAQAIRWAVDHGAKVLNISEGGDEEAEGDLVDAVNYALDKNAVVVAASGNAPFTANVSFPANIPGVVAVSATGKSNALWLDSMTGPKIVLAAPGVGIVGAMPEKLAPTGYGQGDGTSGAAAIVSGVAALIFAKYPSINSASVINRLIRTATDIGPVGRDDSFGYGLVDPTAALTATIPDVTQNPLIQGFAGSSPTAQPRPTASKDSGWISIGVTNTAGAIVQVVLCLALVAGAIVLIVVLIRRSRRRTAVARTTQAPPGWIPPPGAPPGWTPRPPAGPLEQQPYGTPQPRGDYPSPSAYPAPPGYPAPPDQPPGRGR
jgi:type VII secretion-associated serine protease mycosin